MLYQKNANLITTQVVSVEDRAFQYGDGCFTTIRFRHGEILLWNRHLQRFEQSRQQLDLNLDLSRLIQEKDIFLGHLNQQKYTDGVIKILLSRGVGPRGYALPEQPVDVYFYFYPDHNVAMESPKVLSRVGILKDTLGTVMPQLVGIKSLNRLEQIVLKRQAMQYCWDEGLCLNQQQQLIEAISSNCFIFIDGQWCTPTLENAGIDGTMRQEILTRMHDYQIPCQIRMISLVDLQQIDAAFLCNALHPMQIIAQLEQRLLAQHPCHNLFTTLQLAELV
ncbi:aminodeoxychorismate lyase [Acinetobacter qingfengensis]|uniref:Aminodeoxychorismate lyase n=1 Tax=Acinetobacter qingfengensis TaxID=1262585 RepID=A0A1E7REN7_9GAMM|nr:aminodeoxychorismate lyase [Acinetobacter qingfengensis]KAA8734366.1 aminodeoxychorismate lyase [Acinetobacter qingfengensis]OEY97625.1 aminodeoxychorismate lyase [Acinetobacter qingfengensis]